MLTLFSQRNARLNHSRQKGVVLLITLIMLVAMTLAAIALMRSVDTTNLVAGNLAFQQSAVDVGDVGTEEAIAYLYTVPDITCNGTIPTNPCPAGYKSFHEPILEPPNKTWDQYWDSIVSLAGVKALSNPPAGYSGAYIIEAMCASPQQVGCSLASSTSSSTTPQGQDMGSTTLSYLSSTTSTAVHYYRITTRVVGPRNSVGYVQAMIAL